MHEIEVGVCSCYLKNVTEQQPAPTLTSPSGHMQFYPVHSFSLYVQFFNFIRFSLSGLSSEWSTTIEKSAIQACHLNSCKCNAVNVIVTDLQHRITNDSDSLRLLLRVFPTAEPRSRIFRYGEFFREIVKPHRANSIASSHFNFLPRFYFASRDRFKQFENITLW